jgi:hypothetical protein
MEPGTTAPHPDGPVGRESDVTGGLSSAQLGELDLRTLTLHVTQKPGGGVP